MPRRSTFLDLSDPAAQGFRLLHVAFVVAPIVAGLDKFFGVLTDWDRYLAPWIPSLLRVSPHTFMLGVGMVEIAAGILVGVAPRYFAYVVMLWLWGIIVNLLTIPGFFDIALRDFGLSLGALALGRLAHAYSLERHAGGESTVQTPNAATTQA